LKSDMDWQRDYGLSKTAMMALPMPVCIGRFQIPFPRVVMGIPLEDEDEASGYIRHFVEAVEQYFPDAELSLFHP